MILFHVQYLKESNSLKWGSRNLSTAEQRGERGELLCKGRKVSALQGELWSSSARQRGLPSSTKCTPESEDGGKFGKKCRQS